MNPASAGASRLPPEGSVASAVTHDLLETLRRRCQIVGATVVAVASLAFGYSLSQPARYAASADVLLSRQNLAASLNNIQDPGANTSDYNRVAQTQANIATSPAVRRATLKAVGLPESGVDHLLKRSTVKAKPNADILTFEAEDSSPTMARELAAAYAQSYIMYRRSLDSAGVEKALGRVRQRIKDLRSQPQANKGLLASLTQNEDRLSTLEAFQSSNAFLVRSPQSASKISPKPLRALLIGLLFGGLLGVGLAMLRDRFDTRVQDPDEVSQALNLALLARIPELPRRSREAHELVMLSEPHGPSAEVFRTLRTNIDFATIDGSTKVIMVTSSVQTEGKSTTAANLALAFARAGRRVVLVDLDLRRPYLAKFFNLVGRPGVTDVALGRVPLADALTHIDLDSGRVTQAPTRTSALGRAAEHATAAPNGLRTDLGEPSRTNKLRVLTSGPMPADTGEFVGSEWLSQLLQVLKKDADIVLVDAPPLLSVSDALTLTAHVDAVMFVARLRVLRRSMFKDLRAAFASSPARMLGCVVVGVQSVSGYSYTYGYSATNDPIESSASVEPGDPGERALAARVEG